MLKEFGHSIGFLLKFLGIYLGLSVLYSLYLNNYDIADPATIWVSNQTVWVLNLLGQTVFSVNDTLRPDVILYTIDHNVLSVFEGCNGINIFILFVAFVASFDTPNKKLLWFVPLGILIIHVSNLGRIIILYYVSEQFPHYMYFAHKYFFTAIIYVIVFLLWIYWVNDKKKELAQGN